MENNNSAEKLILGLTVAFVYLLMVMGNIVTTTGSGLACPDWPLCYGSVNPPKEISIWFEWGHRLLGALTGLFICVSAFFIWKKANSAMRFFFKAALILVFLAALLGGLIVIVEAPLLESLVHTAIISSHIVISTIIFVCMIMAFASISHATSGLSSKTYALVLFGVIYTQVIIGILVRYSHASLACPDFPLCHGGIIPPEFSPEIALHYLHRLVALAIFLITLWRLAMSFKILKEDILNASVTFGLVLLQGTLGALIVITQMFLPLIVLHGAVGFLLLGWTAYTWAPFYLSQSKAPAPA